MFIGFAFETTSTCAEKAVIPFFYFRQKIVWGNQEPMWPLNQAALKATASERIEMLARSKQNLQENNPEKCSR